MNLSLLAKRRVAIGTLLVGIVVLLLIVVAVGSDRGPAADPLRLHLVHEIGSLRSALVKERETGAAARRLWEADRSGITQRLENLSHQLALHASNGLAASEGRATKSDLHDTRAELQRLEYSLLGSGAIASRYHSVLQPVRDCRFNCSRHGLSVLIPNVTNGCECVCIGGWTGPLCEIEPRSWRLFSTSRVAPVVIPNEREAVPPLRHGTEAERKACRVAAKRYYLERYRTEEFRTDRAVSFFWSLAHHSFTPMCSSAAEQAIMVDIGANVGEQLRHWEQQLLRFRHCSRNDSVLILVEPNPRNLAMLRQQVSHRAATLTSGRAVVVDSAMSYFDGVVRFAVNRRQDRGSHGNERGSMDVKRGSDNDVTDVLETKAERLGSLLRRLSPDVIRSSGNFTISLLKVDAEGFDAAVLYGAHEILHRTNVIVFECHKLWKTAAGYTLQDAVEYLAKMHFRTFKMGLFYWIPLTPPDFWDPVYDETLEWSNCAAVKEGHSLSQLFTLPPPCKHIP